ncbi:MAG: UvrD-helicase domain-containing protein, partial [Erysipelotrichaceae bacterium]|nr:UvrD-helicase domain-containing protein [Erysipelotrichaceae bacterium]
LAVNSSGKNILVSASAGAGKTRVLVERLMKRCVKDRIPLSDILAVTFTEAAAAEMKNRVARGLQELAEKTQEEAEKDYIRKQLILLADADITTIDGFCLDIIRKYYSVIGMDPARVNNVLDEAAGAELHRLAFEKALDEYDRKHHDSLITLLESVSPRPEDFDILQDMVRKTEALCSQYGDAEEWLRKAEENALPVKRLKDLPSSVQDAFFDALTLYYETICHFMNRMEETISFSDKAKKKADDLTLSKNLLLSCEAPLKERNYSFFREMFLSFGCEQKTPAGTDYDPYAKARDAMYKACGSLTKILYEEEVLVHDINSLSPLIHCLLDLTRRTMHYFSESKRMNACMDFTDMEHFAWSILSANGGAVAALFRDRLKEVMVDEFQDTSLLQNEIIEAVSPPGTIFRVGDVKQSIYRFRGAKPSLMRSLLADSSILNIVLNHNYRSKDNIIAFSNELFQKLMNIRGCEDRYSEDDIVTPGTDSQKLETPDPIQLILLEKKNAEEDAASGEDGEEESWSEKECKAGWIASEMIRLHSAGYAWREFCV